MEYVLSDRKLLPYGMMNFEDIRLDNYYYVDKTAFIPLIEQSDRFFFFIRPRRFGKSLTLNMLQHYYDIRTKDKFDALFGDLYIGKHPTKDRNSYLVIKLNFSGISGDLHSYRKGLENIAKSYLTISAMFMPTIYPKNQRKNERKRRGSQPIRISVYGMRSCKSKDLSLH